MPPSLHCNWLQHVSFLIKLLATTRFHPHNADGQARYSFIRCPFMSGNFVEHLIFILTQIHQIYVAQNVDGIIHIFCN